MIMGEHDHMNAHLHEDGTIGYWEPCDDYCKEESAEARSATSQEGQHG